MFSTYILLLRTVYACRIPMPCSMCMCTYAAMVRITLLHVSVYTTIVVVLCYCHTIYNCYYAACAHIYYYSSCALLFPYNIQLLLSCMCTYILLQQLCVVIVMRYIIVTMLHEHVCTIIVLVPCYYHAVYNGYHAACARIYYYSIYDLLFPCSICMYTSLVIDACQCIVLYQ